MTCGCQDCEEATVQKLPHLFPENSVTEGGYKVLLAFLFRPKGTRILPGLSRIKLFVNES